MRARGLATVQAAVRGAAGTQLDGVGEVGRPFVGLASGTGGGGHARVVGWQVGPWGRVRAGCVLGLEGVCGVPPLRQW